MAFNYDKNKQSHGNDSFWTSYSDLFLGLSTIFLLLYVVSSLRTGTDAMKNQVDNQKLTMQVEELQNQLKMYESVKNNYLQEAAPKDEMQEYNELMDKLTLLQEEAKSEKERLAQEALENANKAKALNKYQQMVRNIINANKVAKSRIITRNEIIGEQDTQIEEQQKNISNLQTDINQKERLIAEGKRQIANTEAALAKNLKELQQSYKRNKLTKKAYEAQVRKVKAENEKRLETLRNANHQYNQQLASANQRLNQLNSELENTQANLAQTESQLQGTQAALSDTTNRLQGTRAALQGTQAALADTTNRLQGTQAALSATTSQLQGAQAEAQALQGRLAQAAGEANALRGKINALNSGFAAERARDRKAFEEGMNKLKLGAAERAAREAKFRADADAKARELQRQVAGLQGQLRDSEGALAKAKDEIDTRRAIAQEIARGFAKAGIKADIDMQTGEVVLDFGDAYFESDSANLKPEMRQILEKAMPVYSKSLFGNAKVAEKISNVEIIGFASPTYQGRYIDPKSTKPEDRAALKYNMDLSYRRANAIFKHIVDDKSPDFSHQQDLMALMKVSGRSFLEVLKVQDRNIASAAEFCRVNDCRKAQRVIVRFSVDGKK